MSFKTHYEALEVASTASGDEIKRAFRQLIARYHPDKVQHLGQEFQAMAADRAAELTEAYRVLSDEGRRAEYDRTVKAAPSPAATTAPAPAAPDARASRSSPSSQSPPIDAGRHEPEHHRSTNPHKGAQFGHERASRDEFVRKATIGRVKQALEGLRGYDETPVRGFDFARVPKGTLFGRGKGPRLLGKFVSRVDRESLMETWTQAGKSNIPANEDVCIILMGSSLAAPRELADAITEQRRKFRGSKVTIVPVDARNWDAHVPVDAPAVAKDLLARLKNGS